MVEEVFDSTLQSHNQSTDIRRRSSSILFGKDEEMKREKLILVLSVGRIVYSERVLGAGLDF